MGWGLVWAGVWGYGATGADLALALLVRQPLHRWFVTLHHGHERGQLGRGRVRDRVRDTSDASWVGVGG